MSDLNSSNDEQKLKQLALLLERYTPSNQYSVQAVNFRVQDGKLIGKFSIHMQDDKIPVWIHLEFWGKQIDELLRIAYEKKPEDPQTQQSVRDALNADIRNNGGAPLSQKQWDEGNPTQFWEVSVARNQDGSDPSPIYDRQASSKSIIENVNRTLESRGKLLPTTVKSAFQRTTQEIMQYYLSGHTQTEYGAVGLPNLKVTKVLGRTNYTVEAEFDGELTVDSVIENLKQRVQPALVKDMQLIIQKQKELECHAQKLGFSADEIKDIRTKATTTVSTDKTGWGNRSGDGNSPRSR